jgi:hypothetical protein
LALAGLLMRMERMIKPEIMSEADMTKNPAREFPVMD